MVSGRKVPATVLGSIVSGRIGTTQRTRDRWMRRAAGRTFGGSLTVNCGRMGSPCITICDSFRPCDRIRPAPIRRPQCAADTTRTCGIIRDFLSKNNLPVNFPVAEWLHKGLIDNPQLWHFFGARKYLG
eukprot:423591-Prorocentrum_minimum.AAC.1